MNKTTASLSPPLLEYLIERKQSQRLPNDNNIGNYDCRHIVIGNEAGDADSIISAIAYAYIHDCLFCSSQPQELPSSLLRRLLPIVSISDIDLQTQRPETVLLLKLVGIIPQDHLICINTCKDHLVIDSNPTDTSTKNVDVTLVDHNRFNPGNFRKYIHHDERNMDIDFTVVNIIDHHIDEGYHIETCNNITTTNRNIAFDTNTNVALVASTCTLLVEMLQDHFHNDSITHCEMPSLPLPASLSLLLLGVILLDSINMNVKAGKGTTRDRDAIEYLLQYTDWECTKNEKNRLPPDTIKLLFNKSDNESNTKQNYQPNTSFLFETLQNSKFALEFWQTLSVRDALRLDYKMFSTTTIISTEIRFGISTVLMPYQDFKMKHDFCSTDVNNFIKDMDIAFLCIMLASTNQNQQSESSSHLNREIVFIGQNTTILDEMIDYLINGDDVLQLVEMPTSFATTEKQDMTLNIRAFQQNNNAASRKQVAPLLMKYLTTTTSPL